MFLHYSYHVSPKTFVFKIVLIFTVFIFSLYQYNSICPKALQKFSSSSQLPSMHRLFLAWRSSHYSHFLPLPSTSILPVQKCDFLNLTFLRLTLPECNTVMRYSIETSNRLMVHLAGLINSCVEVEKASGSIKEVVSPSSRPQITFEA